MATIKDVAIMANVSPSTVSRVIKGNTRISKETTQKVHDCMRALNYVPNQMARSLVTKRSKTIGIIQKVVVIQLNRTHFTRCTNRYTSL